MQKYKITGYAKIGFEKIVECNAYIVEEPKIYRISDYIDKYGN